LVRRVVDDVEELRDLRIGRRLGRRHADADEVHAGRLHEAGFVRRTVRLQVDDGLHANRGEVTEVRGPRLRAPEIVVVDLAEVADMNPAERRNGRRSGRPGGLRDGRCGNRDGGDEGCKDTDTNVL